MGKPVGGALADYHGVIVGPQIQWDLIALFGAAQISVWPFDHLAGPTHQFRKYITSRAPSPTIDLSSGYDAYAQSRRKGGTDYITKTEALAKKLARDIGSPAFTVHEPTDRLLMQIIRWKAGQYQRAGTMNPFKTGWTTELLLRLKNLQTDHFAGICSMLSIEGEPIAAHIGMRSTNVMHYWFPSYDPAFSKFSPGIILLLRLAKALAATGVQIIDLGKGESQYKDRLMTGYTEVFEGAVELPSPLSRLRELHRRVEALSAQGGFPSLLFNFPLRALRRIGQFRRFR
jgi:CelD/BcsL family acetyltransferase involved in cellulose biosynthesis